MSFKVMLAHNYDRERIDNWEHVTVEPKVDGVRVIVLAKSGENIEYYSRNGRQLHMFKHLDKQFQELGDSVDEHLTECNSSGVMFDGEMTAKTFGDIAGAIHRKDYTAHDARYLCFHAMPLHRFNIGEDCIAQRHRMNTLGLALSNSKVKSISYNPAVYVKSDADVAKAYQAHRAKGYEGTMVKMLSRPWVASRSYAWMKIKAEETLDLKVIGIKEGTGKYEGTTGAIIVDHKGVEVPVSGMLDAQRHQFWKERKGKNSIIGRTVEIEYQEVTVHGSLRHPRFKRIRDDKGE